MRERPWYIVNRSTKWDTMLCWFFLAIGVYNILTHDWLIGVAAIIISVLSFELRWWCRNYWRRW